MLIATLAQDYAFGRDGVKAFKEAAEAKGAKVVHEEYVPMNTTDFTAPVQRIIQAMKDQKGEKYLFIIWAGKGNPFSIAEMKLDEKYGIKITTGGNILDALASYKPLVGMKGAIYYYYEIPKNPINDWLVKEHQKRFNGPPDFFTCGGFCGGHRRSQRLDQGRIHRQRKIDRGHGRDAFPDPQGRDGVSPRRPSGPAIHVCL